jgi:tRNA threonylcarbamoyladenosine biosynthesis protein TsaE
MNQQEFVASGLESLLPISRSIIDATKGIKVFAFYGKMGAGKTTLIKSFCEALNVIDDVNSPTFSIINEYFTDKEESIFHFDFYRIKKIEEVFDIGYEEYIYSDKYCFLEWPELIKDLLPQEYVHIGIDEAENGDRVISCKIHKG